MKKATNIILIMIIVILITLMGVGYYSLTTNQNKSNEEIKNLKDQIEKLNSDNIIHNTIENNDLNNKNNTANTNSISENTTNTTQPTTENEYFENINKGTYEREKVNGPDIYDESTLIISNETETTFNFEISALHGTDINNGRVNIGNLEGIAKKYEDAGYEYIESIDGVEYRLTINFVGENSAEIKVYYEGELGDPYCGMGVYFDGIYKKK